MGRILSQASIDNFATLQDTRITEASTALRLSGPVQAQLYNVEILNGGVQCTY